MYGARCCTPVFTVTELCGTDDDLCWWPDPDIICASAWSAGLGSKCPAAVLLVVDWLLCRSCCVRLPWPDELEFTEVEPWRWASAVQHTSWQLSDHNSTNTITTTDEMQTRRTFQWHSSAILYMDMILSATTEDTFSWILNLCSILACIPQKWAPLGGHPVQSPDVSYNLLYRSLPRSYRHRAMSCWSFANIEKHFKHRTTLRISTTPSNTLPVTAVVYKLS